MHWGLWHYTVSTIPLLLCHKDLLHSKPGSYIGILAVSWKPYKTAADMALIARHTRLLLSSIFYPCYVYDSADLLAYRLNRLRILGTVPEAMLNGCLIRLSHTSKTCSPILLTFDQTQGKRQFVRP